MGLKSDGIAASLPEPDSQKATVPWLSPHRPRPPHSSHVALWSAWCPEDDSATPRPCTPRRRHMHEAEPQNTNADNKGLHAREHRWVLLSTDPNEVINKHESEGRVWQMFWNIMEN